MLKAATGFESIQNLEGKFENVGGAWCGVPVTQRMTAEPTIEWHYNWQDSECVYNCIIPFGNFSWAELLLWEPWAKVYVSRGKTCFFFGRQFRHKGEAITQGSRSCNYMLIHKSNFDDRDRMFAIIKERAKRRMAHVKQLFKERMEKYEEKIRNRMAMLFDSSQCNSL
jgi:hypothetical protein